MQRLSALGLAIKQARIERELSQEKLAELAKLHRNFIGLIERGQTQPAMGSLFSIADALDMPASDLLRNVEILVAATKDLDMSQDGK
ncbi:helix-turn-helix transcriptional regulator [Dokdonella sp.]|uniref:helix-turn-helix domain-containing protein n=1 Tax=Dokdonella sp. TaxID=2291710 RepID=UPI002DD673BB|nr:helix-turn-helix transcriptional regulator [Dokdonella sp.]